MRNGKRTAVALGVAGIAVAIWAYSMGNAPRDPGADSGNEQKEVTAASWLDNYAQAQAKAEDSGRPILINFTGSDWCGWCIRLDQEVFDRDAFKTYAEENLVLFVADFPRGFELPEDVARQNQQLAQKHGVRGFPTILLIESDGTVIAQTGYRRGGAEAYVEHIEELLANRD